MKYKIKKGEDTMKKVIAVIFVFICVFSVITTYATNTENVLEPTKTSSTLVEIKEKSFIDIITTVSTVLVVVFTDNLAYGVGIGLIVFYLGKAIKLKVIKK